MAKSSIADVYVRVLPTLDGVMRELQMQFQKSGKVIADTINKGINQGVKAGGQTLQDTLTKIAQGAQEDFSKIATAVQLPTDSLGADFEKIANKAGEALQKQVSDAVGNGFAEGSKDLPKFPTEEIEDPVEDAVKDGTHNGAASGFKAAGPAILGVIAALGIGAAVQASITSAMEKEAGTAKMTAALGLDPATAAKAGEVAGTLYKNAYGDSMEGVTDATSAVLSSFSELRSGSAKDIEEVTKRALNMASVFEVDIARSAQVASQMVTTGFAKDATGALDLLSASMSKVPANVREDLVDAIDEYGPFMRSAGLAGEKGMELLIKSAEKGMYGIDKTGDALKEFGIRTSDMTKASKVGYDMIGMSQEKMTRQLLAGGDTGAKAFDKIIDGLRKIKDPVKQSQAALALFGTPLEDLNVTEIPKFLAGLQNTEGSLGDVAQAAIDMDEALGGTTQATWTSFRREAEMTFSEAMIPLIEQLQPLLQQAGQWFADNKSEVAEWVTTVFDGISAVAVPIANTVLPILATVFQWLGDNKDMLAALIPWIIGANIAFSGFSVIGSVISSLGGLVGMLKAVSVAYQTATLWAYGFNLTLLGVAALGVAALAVGFVIGSALYEIGSHFGEIRDTIGQFFGDIGNMFKLITDGSMSTLETFSYLVQNLLVLLANALIAIPNMVVYSINFAFMGINGALDLIPGMEGMEIPMVPTLPYAEMKIPALATGADIMGPTVALIGEGKDPESVVNRGGVNKLIDNVNNRFDNEEGNGGGDTYINVKVETTGTESPEELAWKVAQAIEKQQKR